MRYFLEQGRRSIRCSGYDYSCPGFYFVTICAHEREHLFGKVVRGKMILNEAGRMVQEEWLRTPTIRKNVALDEFIVMPNHVHGIIIIRYKMGKTHSVGVDCNQPLRNNECDNWRRQSNNLPAIIRGFKGASTVKINSSFQEGDCVPIWQRNFYDRIIRDKRELSAIKGYIKANPVNWQRDFENPSHIKNLSQQDLSRFRREYYSACNFI